MIAGAVSRFADSDGLSGDAFGLMEPLRELGNPGFFYSSEHPLYNIMDDVSPFELAKLVDYAIGKHRKDIRKLKELERSCQDLEIACMVEQAYMAGAREIFLEGMRLGIVPNEIENDMRNRLTAHWDKVWRAAAVRTYELLQVVHSNVHAKGAKKRPKVLTTHGTLNSRIDAAILAAINARVPHFRFGSIEHAEHMRHGIVPEIRRYIREGRLSGGMNPLDYQLAVDRHAKRIRRRLEIILAGS